jgi:hypothetical protein
VHPASQTINLMTMPRELDDRWILQLRGEKVTRASASLAGCTLELTGGVSVISNAAIELKDATQASLATAVPYPVEDIRLLVGTKPVSAVVFKSGVVRMVFHPGHHLVLKPSGESRTKIRQANVFEWTGGQALSQMTFPAPPS